MPGRDLAADLVGGWVSTFLVNSDKQYIALQCLEALEVIGFFDSAVLPLSVLAATHCEELATLHDAALQGLEERAAHYAVTSWRTGPPGPHDNCLYGIYMYLHHWCTVLYTVPA